MPRAIRFADNSSLFGEATLQDHEVATEEELLEFVNKGRAAGGANVLEALLPSRPKNPSSCLIANALNFGCTVNGSGAQWFMHLPKMKLDRAQKIADALGCPLHGNYDDEDEGFYGIELPIHITNAAKAFDAGVAFQNFVEVPQNFDE